MENKMKNILLLGLLAVFLSSCSESVQEIQVTTVEVSKTPLNLPNPDPLNYKMLNGLLSLKIMQWRYLKNSKLQAVSMLYLL